MRFHENITVVQLNLRHLKMIFISYKINLKYIHSVTFRLDMQHLLYMYAAARQRNRVLQICLLYLQQDRTFYCSLKFDVNPWMLQRNFRGALKALFSAFIL